MNINCPENEMESYCVGATRSSPLNYVVFSALDNQERQAHLDWFLLVFVDLVYPSVLPYSVRH